MEWNLTFHFRAKTYGSNNPDKDPEEEGFPGYTEVEDDNYTTGDESFKIKYNGVWDGGTYHSQFHGGTEHYAHNGDSFEMKFIGTKVEMWASVDPGHGVYTVTIDGKDAGSANATNDKRVNQQLIYTSPDLENTEHTIKVELKDQPNMAIQLDYLKVYHDEIAPDKVLLDKTEVTLIPGASATLNATVEPWVATNKDILWESSDPSSVSVEDGVVTAADVKEEKTVTITAKSAANEKAIAQATVTVDPSMAFMNAYVGDEKILNTEEEYETLSTGKGSSYQGTAWLGDQLNSKVIVATQGKEVKNVQVTASDFVNEYGTTLSKEHIEINWLKEIKANIGRSNNGAPVKNFPDVIGEGGAKDIAANDVAFAWIKMMIPENTQPGTYHGTVEVSADGLAEPFSFFYTIEVLNLAQPAPEATEIQVWQHPFAVANYYLGLGETPNGGISTESKEEFYFTEEHFNLMRASMKEYASIGGHDAVANIVEEAWNHQSYYNDNSMVKWTKKADGTWAFDYTWYDAWINFLIECGVLDPANGIGQIKCYSIVPWNNMIAYYDEASGKVVKESHKPGMEEWKQMWAPFLTDFMKHSEAKGWFDITYISMDERGLADLEPAVEMIESVKNKDGEHFMISSALNYAAPEFYDFTDRIHDISVNLGNASDVAQMKELSAHRAEKGLTTTFYTCTGDYPSNYIISDPGDNYWDIWYTMTLGTDGYMRWAWDNYVYDMHGDNTYRYWEPGDGWFIYPMAREEIDENYNASFYSTPRYELFKQGIRDVAKAKYLLNSNQVSEESKAELKAVVENLDRPRAGKSYGSAVAANEEERMLTHAETARALDATNKVARELSASIVDTSALETAIKQAEQLDKTNYTAESWKAVDTALTTAKEVLANKASTQTQIDTCTSNLEKAIAALVTLVKVEDKDTGIIIESNSSITPPDATWVIETVKEQDTLDMIQTQLGDLANKIFTVNISLMDGNGVTIQPNGTVKVRIPIPAGFNRNRLAVYYVHENGKESIPFTIEGDMLVFETTHFSLYSIIELKEEPANPDTSDPLEPTIPNQNIGTSGTTSDGVNTGDSTSLVCLLMFAGLSAGTLLVLNKKRKINVR